MVYSAFSILMHGYTNPIRLLLRAANVYFNVCFIFSAIRVSYEERRYNVIESTEMTLNVCVITEDNEPSLRPFTLNSATVDDTAS